MINVCIKNILQNDHLFKNNNGKNFVELITFTFWLLNLVSYLA